MTSSRVQCAFVWIMAGLLTGCTSLRPLREPSEPSEPETLRAHLHQGDRVEAVTRDGQRMRFQVTEAGASALAGIGAKSKGVELPYGQIATIKVRRFSGWKTTFLVVGLIEASIIIAVAVAPPTLLP